MQRQSIIVLINKDNVETWGSLKRACNAHGWKYTTVSQRSLPTIFDGWMVHRSRFNEKLEEPEEAQPTCAHCGQEIGETAYFCSYDCAKAYEND